MDSVTQAAAAAYAAVLSRKTKRSWIIVPGAATNPATTHEDIDGSLASKENPDALGQ
jgi:hypothetical protein